MAVCTFSLKGYKESAGRGAARIRGNAFDGRGGRRAYEPAANLRRDSIQLSWDQELSISRGVPRNRLATILIAL
jgi:hypothetical protein